jgi:hypothetical protein
MAKNPERLAALLGAKFVGEVPDVGGGAFGMARLAHFLHQQRTPNLENRPARNAGRRILPSVNGLRCSSR